MNKRRSNKRKTMPQITPKKSNARKSNVEKVNKKSCTDDIIVSKERRKLTEGEVLMRDTLLHEAKSFKPTNGIHDRVTDLMNGYGTHFRFNGVHHNVSTMNKKLNSQTHKDLSKDHVLHTLKKGYMEICLNNTARHNLLTIGVRGMF